MSGPLHGIIVIDLGQVYNGPYCTMLLARLGADVIKVEPPAGEPVRRRVVGDGESHAFSLLNGGKRGIVLDLKQQDDRTALLALAAGADVLVENFAPGVMERLDLGFDTLRNVNERLIVASGKGYASTGPNAMSRAMDLTVQAMTGVLSATGFPEQPPVKSGAAVADFAAGAHLAVGILAALHERERTGIGQFVEVAMQDAVLPMLTSGLAGVLDGGGALPERTGNHHGGMAYCPYNVYCASDGWIAVLCLTERHWHGLCEVMGRSDLPSAPEYAENGRRVDRMQEVDALVECWTKVRTRADLLTQLERAEVPAAPVQTLREVIDDATAPSGGMIARLTHRSHGERYVYANPIRLADQDDWHPEPAPELGQHTEDVLSALRAAPDRRGGERECPVQGAVS